MAILKLPRGRTPQEKGKMIQYIQRVAAENGITFEKAQSFVVSKLPYAAALLNEKGGPVAPAPAPVKVKEEKDDEVVDRIQEKFDVLYDLAHGACTGSIRSLTVSGVGGVGKTHLIEKVIDHYKEASNLKYEVVHGVLTGIHLFMLLYRNREKGAVVVLDDADGIFKDENALSILKAALDSGLSRKISWKAESKALKDAGIPDEFLFEGAMIFITNMDFQRMVDSGRGGFVPHMQAILTRTMYLDLGLHTQRELLLWIHHIVTQEHILVQAGLTQAQEKEILAFMTENRDRLRNLSIRTALKLASFYQMTPKGWKQMAENIELRPMNEVHALA